MRRFSLISTLGSTGALTDYFDTEKINYCCITGFDLSQTKSFVIGSVRTIECEDGPFEDENISTGLGYLDAINPGDILLVQGSQKWAYFGELMSTISHQRNLAAAIILGKTRDSKFIQDFFPVWSNGYTPVDIKSRGRVKSVGVPLLVEGYEVTEGMMCAADNDGILFFKSLTEIQYQDIEKILLHEQKIKSLISSGKSVKEILKFTDSF